LPAQWLKSRNDDRLVKLFGRVLCQSNLPFLVIGVT